VLYELSPDALVRLECTPLADQREELSKIYFQKQHHNSIEDFLAHHIKINSTQKEGLLMQVWVYDRSGGEKGRVGDLITN